ncbi:hypothetical protein GcC1_020025 [Golovinomyces cichoracearum]|uniref:MULE transposase domain-containing protein n=1 Tax=Golovinomyces cichoracearum TaxID=62708 RepID=A0A420J590_9PEZI|nr:hypothetical protein GcC1_020025 [Golovinomyces cichoracearum]
MSILDDNFFWDYEIINENSAITMLFFAHYSVIRILRDNPQVIILDATHGTQKYGLPLFTIIVITRVGTTFPAAHCFTEREAENNFTWALEYEIELPRVIFHDRDRACINALHAIFPTTSTMLCRWHMDTDVRAWLRVAFGEEQDGLYKSQLNAEGRMAFSSYEKILNATTEENKEIWANFSRYLEKEWLPHKKLCVRAWTNSI